jgi:hypothetical protein
MKLNRILYITLFASALIFVGCGGSDGGDDSPTPPPPTGGNDDEPTIPDPAAATLVFPEDETECNTGVIDPDNELLSTVTFEWNLSQNTDSYSVAVTNLNTGGTTFGNSDTNSVDVKIERGVPYSWFVISRATGTIATAESQTFRFYNEGPGIENYAPFPAEAISPSRGQNFSGISSVNLQWTGSDIDDDIIEYEVFFGTDASALTSIGTVTTETSLADVAVTAATIYYWQVITSDAEGNTSTSEVFEFRVN